MSCQGVVHVAHLPWNPQQASLDIAADSMGLGWTVKASVEQLGAKTS